MKTPLILIVIALAAWTLAGIVSNRVVGISATPIAAALFATLGAFIALSVSHAGR